jgi:hypothetical protein
MSTARMEWIPALRPAGGGTAASPTADTEEGRRLLETRRKPLLWRRWGPYVSERSWGTVREDYKS